MASTSSWKGDYLIQFDGEKVIHAYRFRTDVLMKDDVKDSMPQEVRKNGKPSWSQLSSSICSGWTTMSWFIENNSKQHIKVNRTFTRREPLKVRFTFYIKNELVLVGTFTFRFVQNDFTHTHALRSYFHVFIFLDVFQCFQEKITGGMIRALSSEPEARMLVSFFDLVTLITRSFFVNVFTYHLSAYTSSCG